MNKHKCLSSLPVFLFLLGVASLSPSPAFAQTLTGTVKNATTNKPSSGDNVVLLKLGQGMEEAGQSKTDSKGNFSLKLDDTQSPHLVRIIHQGVTYHRMAPPGTTSVEVEVFDVAEKLEGIATTADVMHFETSQGQIEVQRLFAVDNSSQPRRTQMNDKNFEFYLPDGAKIAQGSAMTAGGQPIALSPVPEGRDGKYAFIFPLRPGETRFEVDYLLPYSGSIAVNVKPVAPVQQFVVIAPKTMQFAAGAGASFQEMQDPQQPGVITQVASSVAAGQSISFRISGEGTLPQDNADANQTAQGGGSQTVAAPSNSPGGGLGPPIDAPDPLQKYHWYILGGFAGILIVGAVVVARRQQLGSQRPPQVEAYSVQETEVRSAPAYQSGSSSRISANPKANLLESLKNEYFELELEHKRSLISRDEYDKTKAALDHILQRALKKPGDAAPEPKGN
jgi:hypothetical protein